MIIGAFKYQGKCLFELSGLSGQAKPTSWVVAEKSEFGNSGFYWESRMPLKLKHWNYSWPPPPPAEKCQVSVLRMPDSGSFFYWLVFLILQTLYKAVFFNSFLQDGHDGDEPKQNTSDMTVFVGS